MVLFAALNRSRSPSSATRPGGEAPAVRLTAADLEKLTPLDRAAGRNRTKAEILVYRWGEIEAVLKDYGSRPFLVRHCLGRWLIAREARAYRAARGAPGLPAFLGRPEAFSLATERFDGRPLSSLEPQAVDAACFDRLESILDGLHARGVAVGDLHRRNVLVSTTGTVALVDLACAWVLGPRPGALRRWIFGLLRDLDRAALTRMRARHAGLDPDAALAREGGPGARWHRRGRRIKGWVDRLRGQAAALRVLAVYACLLPPIVLARPTVSGVIVGCVPLVAGGSLRFWAAGHLVKTRRLITSGPYRYTRNPLYLGRLMILTGLLWMARLPFHGNLILLALGYLVFFGYYLPRKERVEPARLRALHGEAFDRYRASVPALFPTGSPYPAGEPSKWSAARMARNREYLMVAALALVVGFLFLRATNG